MNSLPTFAPNIRKLHLRLKENVLFRTVIKTVFFLSGVPVTKHVAKDIVFERSFNTQRVMVCARLVDQNLVTHMIVLKIVFNLHGPSAPKNVKVEFVLASL
jgi:hypothetical protein